MASSPVQHIKHIWVIAGPAGCGKSSIATHLASILNLPFLEGDDYHSKENRAKMHSGVPLTDADRWDWLITLREEAVREISAGTSGAVIACSALKQKYRDVIRIAAYYDRDIDVHFVYLHANEEILVERVAKRQGHYMKGGMVHGQLEDLEEPSPAEEAKDCLKVDVSGASEEVQALAVEAVKGAIAREAATTHAKTLS